MVKLKYLLGKLERHNIFKNQIHQKKINRDLGNFCMPRKGKLGKLRDYVKMGNIISTDIEIADILNNHFGSVFYNRES